MLKRRWKFMKRLSMGDRMPKIHLDKDDFEGH